MTNTDIKRYLKNELSIEEKIQFIEQIENDLFLKESIEGLEMWLENKSQDSIDTLEDELNTQIDNILRR